MKSQPATLTVLTNGDDADVIPGPLVLVGAPITWTYLVENRSRFTLLEVAPMASSIPAHAQALGIMQRQAPPLQRDFQQMPDYESFSQ